MKLNHQESELGNNNKANVNQKVDKKKRKLMKQF